MRDFRAAFILVSISIMIMTGCGGGGESGTPVVKATVSGTILDSRNNPVPAATVTINSTPVTTTSDSSGNFSVQIEIGDHEIMVEKMGHSMFASNFSVPSGSPVNLGSLISSGFYPAYLDSDGDGYGDSSHATAFSTDSLPASYVEDHSDCDDSQAGVNPGAVEACNQVDDDCDTDIDEGFDSDSDGYTTCGGDCDDAMASVFPGATEICNGIDDNCTDGIDEGVLTTFYQDSDTDGYGDQSSTTDACEVPSGYVADSTDCDDTAGSVNPGAEEVCNEIDDNCVGGADEGVLLTFYQDSDSDSYGDSSGLTMDACSAPTGFVADNTDCDDTLGGINPGVTEVCDGVDNNCVGGIDEGLLTTYYLDSDTDTYGDPATATAECSAPAGHVTNGLDCDDTSGSVNPGVTEVCDGIDNNCVSGIDEGLLVTYYLDSDTDTYGDPATVTAECSVPANHVTNGLDCDDSDSTVNPDGTEVCDDKDNDCSGTADEGLLITYYRDSDSDTYGDPAVTSEACIAPAGYVQDNTDCNDGDINVNPGEAEICDGLDNNCTGGVDEGVLLTWYQDADTDTYGNVVISAQACTAPGGYVADGTDCDDTDGSVNPEATEVCDSVDNNCVDGIDEGLLTAFYPDTDSDGFGDSSANSQDACTAPGGFVADNTDCDDQLAAVNPAVTETCNGLDDDCDGGIDTGLTKTYFLDQDLDGYGDPAASLDDCSQPTGYISDNQDCDDTDPDINPETVWYADNDQDQWPTSVGPVTQCAMPSMNHQAGHTVNVFDCDDTTGTLSPGNLEIQENAIDDDCNTNTSDNLTAYTLSDLAGTWNIVGINAGDSASSQWNGWMEGSITFNSMGQYTDYSLTYDDNSTDKTPSFTQLWVNPDGTITTTQAPELHGALSQDKDTIVATFTDEEGGYTMYILQKKAVSVLLDDFAGIWYAAGVAAGDTPGFSGWKRGIFDVQPDGRVFIFGSDSSNYFENGWVDTGLDFNGALTDQEIVRYISPDGQMVAGRGYYRGGYILTTLIKSGGAFLPGNLSGDWSFHVLSVGDAPEVNGWGHGMMSFDDSGVGMVNHQSWSDPTAVIDLGTLSTDGAGVIVSDTLHNFEGHLSRNKDTITATFTNDSGGASMLVALRRDKPALGIVPEEHNSVSAIIGSAGGFLQAFSDDGVQYDFAIPTYALGDPELELTVKMTPLSALEGLPVSGSFMGAVQFAPEGLQLVEPAVLSITAPGIFDPTDPVSYVYQGSGDDFRFMPLLPSFFSTGAGHTSVLVPVEHFSGGGIATGTLSDMLDLEFELQLEPSFKASYYRLRIASVLKEMNSNGIWNFSDPDVSNIYLERIRSILRLWFWDYIIAETRASQTIEELVRVLHEYANWLQMIGSLVEEFSIFCVVNPQGKCVWSWDNNLVIPSAHDTMRDEVNTKIDTIVGNLDTDCEAAVGIINCDPNSPDPCPNQGPMNWCAGGYYWDQVQPWIYFKPTINNLMGWDSPDNLETEFQAFCSGIDDQLPGEITGGPKSRWLDVGETDTFSGTFSSYRALRGEGTRIQIPISVWTSEFPHIATIGSDGIASGVSPGVTPIHGWDDNKCADIQGGVLVADPFIGTWRIHLNSRPLDTCAPPPDMANPATVNLRVSGDQLLWIDDDQGYFYQMVGDIDRANPFKVEIRGDDLLEALTQNCTLEMGASQIKGQCGYTDYDNSSQGNPCTGIWKFKATKE